MKTHRIRFTGELLERGFWLYVWKIASDDKEVYYVGRTGDSSSRFVASPFSRLSQHLDVRKSASANMVIRQIRNLGLDPLTCQYEMIAVGPLFPEQETIEEHRVYRDQIAPLERALAEYLREKGLEVVGKHPPIKKFDEKLFLDIKRLIDDAHIWGDD